MEKREAYRLLGIHAGDGPLEIRRKYHQLMHMHHPDASGEDDFISLETAKRLNEAFRIVKREGFFITEEHLEDWGIRENPAAFCERKIYMEDDLFGDPIILDTGAAGRFYWDPEMETFPLLLKSLGEAAGGLLERASGQAHGFSEEYFRVRAKLLHLLIQEYVDAYECLEFFYPSLRSKKDGHRMCTVRCHLKLENADCGSELMETRLRVKAQESRLYAYLGDVLAGQVTFEENHLYYLVTPLVLQGTAQATLVLQGTAQATLRVAERALGGAKSGCKKNGQKNDQKNDQKNGNGGGKACGRGNGAYFPCELRLLIGRNRLKDMTEEINREISATLKRFRSRE